MNIRRIIVATTAVLTLAACGYNPTPEARLTELERVYQQGQKAAESMRGHGIEATDKSCEDMYAGSGLADDKNLTNWSDAAPTDDNKIWQQQRKTSYLNGCMGRKNDINATPSSSASS